MLCRTDTWKIPSSIAIEWCPAPPRSPEVSPGTNPAIPTSRNTMPTTSATFWIDEPA